VPPPPPLRELDIVEDHRKPRTQRPPAKRRLLFSVSIHALDELAPRRTLSTLLPLLLAPAREEMMVQTGRI
jgi:hypothetical protein